MAASGGGADDEVGERAKSPSPSPGGGGGARAPTPPPPGEGAARSPGKPHGGDGGRADGGGGGGAADGGGENAASRARAANAATGSPLLWVSIDPHFAWLRELALEQSEASQPFTTAVKSPADMTRRGPSSARHRHPPRNAIHSSPNDGRAGDVGRASLSDDDDITLF